MQENMDLWDFKMTPAEVEALGRINTPCVINLLVVCIPTMHYPIGWLLL
jgi:hypothetical protein